HYNRMFTVKKSSWSISDNTKLEKFVVNGVTFPDILKINGEEELTINAEIILPGHVDEIEVNVSFNQPSGDVILQANSKRQNLTIKNINNKTFINIKIKSLNLGSGLRIMAFRVLDSKTN